MKITCSKDVLQKAVNIVSKAVSSRTTMPILECLLIHTDADKIYMTANDTELGIETLIDGIITNPGKLAVDAKIFSEIIRRLPDNMVEIETITDSIVQIQCEKIHFSIPCQNPEEFTFMPEIQKDKTITLSQFTLKEIIRQTIFSIAENDSNAMMAGELMEIRNDTLKLVSLDGHRISIRTVRLTESYDPIKVVIPGKTLNEVSKILTGTADSTVSIYFTKNHILFEFDDTSVVSRLIEGEYYRIDQMLNSDYSTKLQISRQSMSSCIERAALLIKESDKKPIIIKITDTEMEVRLNSAYGSMNETLPICKTGKDLLIGFNPKFLSDALRAISEETVSIYLISPKAPCFIRDDEGSYTYLILPVNFNV